MTKTDHSLPIGAWLPNLPGRHLFHIGESKRTVIQTSMQLCCWKKFLWSVYFIGVSLYTDVALKKRHDPSKRWPQKTKSTIFHNSRPQGWFGLKVTNKRIQDSMVLHRSGSLWLKVVRWFLSSYNSFFILQLSTIISFDCLISLKFRGILLF